MGDYGYKINSLRELSPAVIRLWTPVNRISGTENPRVGGSIPSLATISRRFFLHLSTFLIPRNWLANRIRQVLIPLTQILLSQPHELLNK